MSAAVRGFRTLLIAVAVSGAVFRATADVAPTGPSALGDNEPIAVTGQVEHELTLSAADLRRMTQVSVTVSYLTGHGPEAGTFSGPALWDVLETAVLRSDEKKGALLRHVIAVTGRDGYAVAVAAAEIAPDFEHKQVILAIAKNGSALDAADGIRLIVPGDAHGGRAVRDVVAIEVK